MKNIVLFKSKYGNTKQYATWIANDLGWEIRDFSDFKKAEIDNYDKIVFGTGVYIGKMNKIKKALKYFAKKPIIIFACAGNPGTEKEIDDIKKNNFKHDELSFHKFFYLPGGVDFTKVKGLKSKMFNFYKKVLEKKKDLTSDEKAILDSFDNPTNFVEKKNTSEIIDYIKEMKQIHL